MALTGLSNAAEFDAFVKGKDLSVVHFYAEWAEQCGQINAVLEEMQKSADYKGVKLAKVLAEDLPEISLKNNVSGVPTVILFRAGVSVDRVDGANPGQLASKIKEQMTNADKYSSDDSQKTKSLEERLKRLINQSPCVLFMKGDRQTPRCGFSRTIVALLDGQGTDYTTFDILQDDSVREGLKKFSNWPTYPQLYINGELIGGLDIVKEMAESGDLDSILPKKC